MFKNQYLLKPLALAALCFAAGASQAAITVYTTQSSFLASVGSVGTDGFNGFPLTEVSGSPMTRTAGAYSYTAEAYNVIEDHGDSFYGAGTAANPWLSTNDSRDSITFKTFTTGVNGIGGNFFGSDFDGAYLTGAITLVATDSTGSTLTQTINPTSSSSFLGFVSSGTLVSLVITSSQAGSLPLFPTVDNLMLAAPVPEPQTYALLLAGLGLVGFVARRRS